MHPHVWIKHKERAVPRAQKLMHTLIVRTAESQIIGVFIERDTRPYVRLNLRHGLIARGVVGDSNPQVLTYRVALLRCHHLEARSDRLLTIPGHDMNKN
jgi:hypothetical protein